MQVYEWFSYSCNNSSDHRLVAEFDSDVRAQAMADELRTLFLAHAKQVDEAMEEGDDWVDDEEPSPALTAFAEKHGAEMGEGISWGDGDLYVDDLPEVVVLGRSVYVYHGYMGGFGDLSGVLDSAGAVQVEADNGPACLQFAVTAKPGEGAALQTALDGLFAQRETKNNLSDWDCPWERGLPIYTKLENLALVHGERDSTFVLPVAARALPALTAWLESAGAASIDAKLVNAAEIAELRKADQATLLPRYETTVLHRELATGPAAAWETLVALIHWTDQSLVLCGGAGKNLLRVSHDGGKTFASRPVEVGAGLRGYLEEGRTVFVSGQSGLLARSVDGGPFEAVDTGATKCAQLILRADGALWQTGDSGVFYSTDDGATWAQLSEIDGEVSRPRDSALGFLLPISTGRLYIRKDGVLRATALQASEAMWATCATPKGTILAVGKAGIWRSTDAGASFQRITVAKGSLENVVCTDSGRVVVVGEHGLVLHSADDGVTFQRVAQPHTQNWLFGVAALGERILVGGMDGWVLEVVPQAG